MENRRFRQDGMVLWARGIGYGDDDDATVIEPALSVFMRTDMQVVDPDEILQARLLIDYDDAFVAYLNGVEIGAQVLARMGRQFPLIGPRMSPTRHVWSLAVFRTSWGRCRSLGQWPESFGGSNSQHPSGFQ